MKALRYILLIFSLCLPLLRIARADLASALDITGYTFTGEDYAEFTGPGHDPLAGDVDMVRVIGDPENGGHISTLSTQVTGPCVVSFWWKMDSVDSGYVEVNAVDGFGPVFLIRYDNTAPYAGGWCKAIAVVEGSGPRELRWEFKQDWYETVSTLYLDEMVITPLADSVPVPTDIKLRGLEFRPENQGFQTGPISLVLEVYSVNEVYAGLFSEGGAEVGAGPMTDIGNNQWWVSADAYELTPANSGPYVMGFMNGNPPGNPAPALYPYKGLYAFDYESALFAAVYTPTDILGITSYNGVNMFEPVSTVDSHDDPATDGVTADNQVVKLTSIQREQTHFAFRLNSQPGVLKFWTKFDDVNDLSDANGDDDGRVNILVSGSGYDEQEFRDFATSAPEWREHSYFFYDSAEQHVDISVIDQKNGASLMIDDVQFIPQAGGPVTFVTQPRSWALTTGMSVLLESLAYGGDYDITYQWYRYYEPEGEEPYSESIDGANTNNYYIPSIQLSQAGKYYCVATSATEGSAQSQIVELSVGSLEDAVDYVLAEGESPFFNDVNDPWVMTNDPAQAHDGVDALVTPAINPSLGGSAELVKDFPGPAVLSFWWKATGDPNANFSVYASPSHAGADYNDTSLTMGEWTYVTIPLSDNNSNRVQWKLNQWAASEIPAAGYLDQVTYTEAGSSVPIPASPERAFDHVFPFHIGVEEGMRSYFWFDVYSGPSPGIKWFLDDGDEVREVALDTTPEPGEFEGATEFLGEFVMSADKQGRYFAQLENSVGTNNNINNAPEGLPSYYSGFFGFYVVDYEMQDYAEGIDSDDFAEEGFESYGTSLFRLETDGGRPGGDSDRVEAQLTSDQYSAIDAYVVGPGTLTFWWKRDGSGEVEFYADDDYGDYTNIELESTENGNWVPVTLHLTSSREYYLRFEVDGYPDGPITVGIDSMSFAKADEGETRIVEQPVPVGADEGATAYFGCLAYGQELQYAWFREAGAVDEPVGSGAILTLENVDPSDAGYYYCVVTGDLGSETSAPASLTIDAAYNDALESTDTYWASYGDPIWAVVAEPTATNGSAVTSTSGGHVEGSTVIETRITGPRTLQFDLKAQEAGSGYNRAYVEVNNVGVFQNSGSFDWTTITRYLPEGENTVRVYFSYEEVSGSPAQLWLDNVRHYNPNEGPLVFVRQPVNIIADAGADVSISTEAIGSGELSYSWYSDWGDENDGLTGPVFSLSAVDSNDQSAYHAEVSNGTDIAYSDTFYLYIANIGETIGYTDSLWVSYGYTPWQYWDQGYNDDMSVAATGSGENNYSTSLETTIYGSGSFSFWYRLSTEQDHDFLRIYLNGVEIHSDSGIHGWQRYMAFLHSGANHIRFVYEKDGSGTAGEDLVWVDHFEVTRSVGYNEFLTSNGLTPGDSRTGPNDDWDRDGIANIFEHFFRLPPDAANPILPFLSYGQRQGGNSAVLGIPMPLGAPSDVKLKVSQSTNLMTWTPLAELLHPGSGWQFLSGGTPQITSYGSAQTGQITVLIYPRQVLSNPPSEESAAPNMYLRLEATLNPPVLE